MSVPKFKREPSELGYMNNGRCVIDTTAYGLYENYGVFPAFYLVN